MTLANPWQCHVLGIAEALGRLVVTCTNAVQVAHLSVSNRETCGVGAGRVVMAKYIRIVVRMRVMQRTGRPAWRQRKDHPLICVGVGRAYRRRCQKAIVITSQVVAAAALLPPWRPQLADPARLSRQGQQGESVTRRNICLQAQNRTRRESEVAGDRGLWCDGGFRRRLMIGCNRPFRKGLQGR
ncbi:hypothetical protein CCM_01723 [Cordyceps militaris CM01]|uniref:Uncharacterized protein n=1 Tax=Cordyceps militaris (strain CM01) TaxID=983644 RepID=G3J6Z1_CORMM|nr:uncharacterized protein CCM_01723 [Cordyceps militaris CM01]EGX97064.1 hypothetical protein CCM_01723 [Cordyceps militaris CM01]